MINHTLSVLKDDLTHFFTFSSIHIDDGGPKGSKSSADVWLLLKLEHHLKVGVLLMALSQKACLSTS